jgi:hypothetical protein
MKALILVILILSLVLIWLLDWKVKEVEELTKKHNDYINSYNF